MMHTQLVAQSQEWQQECTYLQGAQVLPVWRIELDHADFAAISGTSRQVAGHCEDGAVGVPFDAAGHHARVD